jgi:hypothetical protein
MQVISFLAGPGMTRWSRAGAMISTSVAARVPTACGAGTAVLAQPELTILADASLSGMAL